MNLPAKRITVVAFVSHHPLAAQTSRPSPLRGYLHISPVSRRQDMAGFLELCDSQNLKAKVGAANPPLARDLKELRKEHAAPANTVGDA